MKFFFFSFVCDLLYVPGRCLLLLSVFLGFYYFRMICLGVFNYLTKKFIFLDISSYNPSFKFVKFLVYFQFREVFVFFF